MSYHSENSHGYEYIRPNDPGIFQNNSCPMKVHSKSICGKCQKPIEKPKEHCLICKHCFRRFHNHCFSLNAVQLHHFTITDTKSSTLICSQCQHQKSVSDQMTETVLASTQHLVPFENVPTPTNRLLSEATLSDQRRCSWTWNATAADFHKQMAQLDHMPTLGQRMKLNQKARGSSVPKFSTINSDDTHDRGYRSYSYASQLNGLPEIKISHPKDESFPLPHDLAIREEVEASNSMKCKESYSEDNPRLKMNQVFFIPSPAQSFTKNNENSSELVPNEDPVNGTSTIRPCHFQPVVRTNFNTSSATAI